MVKLSKCNGELMFLAVLDGRYRRWIAEPELVKMHPRELCDFYERHLPFPK